MRRKLLLDLYCKEGGASAGYAAAGFEVIGVDINPQPRYPFEFIQGDAFEVGRRLLSERPIAAVVGSPPCQQFSALRHSNDYEYPDLVDATRVLMLASGLPYVIENVQGAPLHEPVKLCGSMFGLGTAEYELRRHRLFETNFDLPQPACKHSDKPVIGVYGGKARLRRRVPHWGTNLPKTAGEQAMGINWMTNAGLSEAVPPAYTRYVGQHLMAAVHERAAAYR